MLQIMMKHDQKIAIKLQCVRRKLLTYTPPLERTPNQIFAVCCAQVEQHTIVNKKTILGMLEIFCDKSVDLRIYFNKRH